MVITPAALRATLWRPMIVHHTVPYREFPPASRWLILIAVGLNILFISPSAQAHAPFDSSARIIVLEQEIEATVTVGTGLAEKLLTDSGGQSIPTTGVGPGKVLPVELAGRFFEMESNDKMIAATQLRVLSDGLEALFVVTYPRPPAEAFRLHSQFARHLPGSNFCALVVTDDNHQLLGSHLVKSGSATADFNLPKLPGAIIEAVPPASVGAQLAAPAEAITSPLKVSPSQPRPRFGALIIIAAVIALGGAWLIQRTFRREQN